MDLVLKGRFGIGGVCSSQVLNCRVVQELSMETEDFLFVLVW